MNLENELKTLLRDDGPDSGQSDEWVRHALEATPSAAPRSPWTTLGWVAAAAAAAVVLVFMIPRDDSVAPPRMTEEAPSTVDVERAANMAALKAVDDEVWKSWKGKFAVVAGGTVKAAGKLDDALAWAEKKHPKAQHRFVFRIEDHIPGDVIADRAPVRELIVGLGFLQDLGINVEGAPGEWRIRRDKFELRVAELKATVDLEFDGKTLRFDVEPESLCPIMLPANAAYPRWEIPGTAIFEGLDRKWRSYRRYSVRVRNKSLGVDGLFEACGAKYEGKIAPGNVIAVRLATHVFHALHSDPAVCAQREGRPLVVLHLKDADTEGLDCDLIPVKFDGYSQYFVPGAKRSELRRYSKEGKLEGKLLLPARFETMRKFLR